MAIQKIKLPDNSTEDIHDSRISGVTSSVTEGSTSVVTSGGVYTAINAKTDTKNTAGATNSDSKLYLVGAQEQSANPQTYTNSDVYTQDGEVNAAKFNGPLEVSYDDTTNNTSMYKGVLANKKVYTNVLGVPNGSSPNNNTYANQSFYFLTVTPKSWDAQWSVRYTLNIHLDDETKQYKSSSTASVVNAGLMMRGTYFCNINGTAGTYNTFHFFQSQKNTSYRPIYYHMIHQTTSAGFTAGYGHKIGVSLTSSYLPNPVTDYSSGSAVANTRYSRTIEVVLEEAINCTATLSDELEIEADAYRTDYPKLNSTYYTTSTSASNSAGRWTNLSATTQGLYESADDNTFTYTQQTYNYLKNATKNEDTGIRIFGYGIIGFNTLGQALGISVYSGTQTTSTTSISKKGTRLYCTEGFDYTKGIRYTNSSTVFTYDADMNISTTINHSSVDLRYSDNCVASVGEANSLGLIIRKPIYLRGTIGQDGLFYLAPIDVTYNNETYQRAWVQDIPSVENEDGEYVYWFIGYPYWNSSYPNSLYTFNLITQGELVCYKNGSVVPYVNFSASGVYSKTEVDNLINGRQPKDDDLTAIAGLSGTSGVLKKTAANTWALDTNIATYASNGNTAYGWGNHASAGYLTSAVTSVTKGTATSGGAVSTSGGAVTIQFPTVGVTSVTLTSGTGITVSDSGTAITGTGSRTISLNVSGAKTALGLGTMAYETASNYLTTTTAASTYVKLSPGTSEQTISSSISSFVKGVINLWRSSGDHYTFLGFSNGTTETYLGGIGFKSQSDHNLYHKDGSNYYTIFDENNYTSYVNTTNFPGLNSTGTITSVKVGSTSYSPSSGVVSLPAYPSDYWKTGDSRTANYVLAAPNGSNGAATFRKLVAADIPSLTVSKISDIASNYVSIATANTITAKHTFSNGILLNTASSWTSSDRAIAFSADGEDANLRYYNTDSNKGLTFNPNTGELKAAKFTRRGGTSSQFLKADGSVDSNTYLTSNQTIILSGDVSGSGTTSINVSIGSGKVTNAMLEGSIAWSKLSVSASNITSTLGTTAVSRATADADGNTISSTYVKKAGDTMTGDLAIQKSGGGVLSLYGTAHNGNAGEIVFQSMGTQVRNGCKISAVAGSTAYDLEDLVFYTSNNTTSPYAPDWKQAMHITASGQTFIYGQYTYSLYVDNTASGATSAGIRFRTEGTIIGGIFVNSSNDLYFAAGTSSTGSKVLTADNYDGYALPLAGGTMAGSIKLPNGSYINAESGYAMCGIGSGGETFYCGPGAEITNAFYLRSGNIDLTHVKAGTNYTIWDASNSNLSTVDWTANNLTVAGTSTFSDTMYVENRKYMQWKDSGGTYRNVFGLNNSDSLLIGYGLSSVTGSSTVIHGETVRLQAANINEIVNTGGATLVMRGTQLNNQVHTILFRGSDSESNGFKIETTAASSYGRQSLGFYRSNVASGSAPYTPVWKRSLYMPYDGGVIIGTSSDACNLTVYGTITSSGTITAPSTSNVVFADTSKTLAEIIPNITISTSEPTSSVGSNGDVWIIV